mgnify:CR=1 FL=1
MRTREKRAPDHAVLSQPHSKHRDRQKVRTTNGGTMWRKYCAKHLLTTHVRGQKRRYCVHCLWSVHVTDNHANRVVQRSHKEVEGMHTWGNERRYIGT